MQPTAHRDQTIDMPDGEREDAEGREGRKFLSLAIRKSDLLRMALVAAAAYLVTVELVYLFGYEIPTFRSLPPAITVIAPYIVLAAGSVVALFIKPRLGIIFALIALLVILVATLAPGHG